MEYPVHGGRSVRPTRGDIRRIVRRGARSIAKIRQLTGEFLADAGGGIMMTFAYSMVVMVVATGMVIDLGRAYTVKSRITYALDAAGLAVGTTKGTEAELQQVMLDYFNANYRADELGVPATPTMVFTNIKGNKGIELSARADVPMMFVRLIGIKQVPVAAATSILEETAGFEIAMVLDNTGSMGQSKMNQLRIAAADFVEVIYGPGVTSLPNVWISVVPYTAAVNIGASHADWLAPWDRVNASPSDFAPTTWKGCVEARLAGGLDETDAPPNDPFKSFYWLPAADNDWGPTTNPSSIDKPNHRIGPNVNCADPILPLTNDRTQTDAAIANMVSWSRGGTAGSFGLVWGWRTLSPKWRGRWGAPTPATHPLDYGENMMEKVVIMMTDGVNQIVQRTEDDVPVHSKAHTDANYPSGHPYRLTAVTEGLSDYTSYGRIKQAGWASIAVAKTAINTKFSTICEKMKAEGIIIYTVTFELTDVDTKALYENCASSPANYFDATGGQSLSDAFKKIGEDITRLRVAH